MGCLVVILALLFPRAVLFIFWAFTSYDDYAFAGWVWPLLGFFFAPFSTMVYLFAQLSSDGSSWSCVWYGFMVIAVIMDVVSFLYAISDD